MPGTLLVISGASGVGKSTVVARLLEHVVLHFSVSVTTRSARPYELDGVHYHFVSRDEFVDMIEGGDLFEWAEYSGNLYGTPKAPLLERLAAGETVLLELENQGALQMKAAYSEALTIFLVPPSMAELRHRLLGRGDTSTEEMGTRLEVAELQLAHAQNTYDYVVVNDETDGAVAEIMRILEEHERGQDVSEHYKSN